MNQKYSTPAELLVGSFKNPRFADKACLVDSVSCRMLTYSNMDKETAKAAGILKWLGVGKGDTVSILLENGLNFFMPWLGAIRMGAVAHPINCLYTPEQVLYALELCKAKILVTQERYLCSGVLLEAVSEKFPDMPILVMPDKFEGKTRVNPSSDREARFNILRWDKNIGIVGSFDGVQKRELLDPFQYICTSGTTGKPKAVIQHNGMFEPNVRDLIDVYGFTSEDRGLLINRLFHVNAQVTNFYAMTLIGGTTVLASPDPKTFLETLSRRHITYSSVIPPILKYALEHPILIPAELKKVRFFIVGADILSPELHGEFIAKTGILVRPGYGLTETLCWASGTGLNERVRLGSIGKSFPHTEMKVVDPENNWAEVPNGVSGRLILKGDNVFKEYLDDPEATQKAFAPSAVWGDGWFDTGDTCVRNESKIYDFVCRASADTWKVRGEFVQGTLVDEFVKAHPAVDDAMAVPITVAGETETAICAVLEGRNKTGLEWSAEILEDELLKFCEEGRKGGKLEKHIKVKRVIFVERIELGDTGKKSRNKMKIIAQAIMNK